jgi:hypothetical protein
MDAMSPLFVLYLDIVTQQIEKELVLYTQDAPSPCRRHTKKAEALAVAEAIQGEAVWYHLVVIMLIFMNLPKAGKLRLLAQRILRLG